MQNKVTFEYAIIRFVPKVEREEFINVGVILFSKRKKYLGMRYKIDEQRINSFANDLDLCIIKDYLKAWDSICEGEPNGGVIGKLEMPLRFRWLVAARSTMLQSSKTHSGLCIDPEKVLEDLFERYVL